MKKFFAVISLLVLTFSQIALVHADNCGEFQTELGDGTCFDLNESSSSANGALALVGVAAVGYGIYKMTSSDDTPEEANLRAQEFSNGYGLRLNNINAPIRISTMGPVSYNAVDVAKDDGGNKSNFRLGMLRVEYIW
jgi:hypothetical protein